ncbi:MAG: hypothetical protein IPN49_06020 [Saprospiraceae bacterium]|nr:hypothetical protein [Saprospiraceae bacterium]
MNNAAFRIFVFTCLLFTVYLVFSTHKEPGKVIWSDGEGYYVYLPSVFIFHDFVKDAVRDTGYIKAFQDTGKIFSKYTCGVAILEMPFFLASHWYTKLFGLLSTGKTDIYGRGLCWSAAFYLWAGMIFLYYYIKKYYSSYITMLAIAGILCGTNLYFYTFLAPSMSHIYSFFLFSVFLWKSDFMFRQKLQIKGSEALTWALFGLLLGMIVLIRPTNIIIFLLPLYQIQRTENNFISYVKEKMRYIMLAALCFFIPWIPQFMYWKYISGNWIIWSYSDEGFHFWMEPKLLRVLFDPWNGWILYSPMVVLPLVYLWWNRNRNQHHERIYLYIFLLATYIFSSWWAWWFGGAFGHRSYVEFLAFLVLPLAGLIHVSWRKKWAGIALTSLIILLCYYNLGLTYAYRPPWDGAGWTYESWWSVVRNLFIF